MNNADDEVPTCGKGLAANSGIPARMADLLEALAENLEAHLPTIDQTDVHGVTEHEAYVQLVHAHREIAIQLHSAAALMAAHRDLPMARHLPDALGDPRLVQVFRTYVDLEEGLLGLLSASVASDRKMLRAMDGESPSRETR